MWRNYDPDVVMSELRVLRDGGLATTRTFLFWPDFHPAPDTIDQDYVDRYLNFLDVHEQLGMDTIPTFLVGHMSGDDYDVAWREGRDLYRDGFMLGQQAFFIREIVRRLGPHPAIRSWLISNEFTNYAGIAPREYVRAWGIVCVDAVRAGGSELPVSLGDGAWTMENLARDNGFRLRDQLDVVDFVGPHAYPMDTDQVRVHFAASTSCEYSHFGKPVILEEFGVPDALSSPSNTAALYRQTLHNSLLAGATGWLAWNNTDFPLPNGDPYWHHPFELGFGITTAEGHPKPALDELSRFGAILEAVDFAQCGRQPTAVTVVLASYTDLHPRIPEADRWPIPQITQQAYIAAKSADLAPAVVREENMTTATDLVIVPSAKLLTAPTFEVLETWAAHGSTVFVSWFAGVSGQHRGAWWPDVARFVGLPHRLRYGMLEPVDEIIEFRFEHALGTIRPGESLRFPVSGAPDSRSMLPLDDATVPPDVEIIARDGGGRPALVRRRVGAGAVIVSTYAIEYFAAARAGANADDEVSRLYAALAAEAGVLPVVRTRHPLVYADGLRHSDGREFTWFVNLSGETVESQVDSNGAVFVDVLDGARFTDEITLPPFGVVVAARTVVRTP